MQNEAQRHVRESGHISSDDCGATPRPGLVPPSHALESRPSGRGQAGLPRAFSTSPRHHHPEPALHTHIRTRTLFQLPRNVMAF